MIFVAIVGDGHRQLPQMSLLGGDVHHLVFYSDMHIFSIHKTENDAVIPCAYLLSEYHATLPLSS